MLYSKHNIVRQHLQKWCHLIKKMSILCGEPFKLQGCMLIPSRSWKNVLHFAVASFRINYIFSLI